jgi:pimeloyl-ACP methyl ester carboxylesterase
MATFVLIHGANLGGWCWRLVTPALRAGGHEVYAPSLTGCGDRSHLLSPQIGLETWVEDVTNLMFHEDVDNAVLVGHSNGATVALAAADRMPQRVAHIVALDGFLLRDGESRWQTLPEDLRASFEQQLAAMGETWKAPPAPAEAWVAMAREQGWSEMVARWAAQRASWNPLKPDKDALDLKGGERFEKLPRTFVRCTRSPEGRPDAAGRARELGWPVLDLEAPHLAPLSSPRELASLLLELAEPYGL